MTMNLIKHGTPRAGFKDWPTYDNKPGKEEPDIARCAVPDPDWEKEPPPKTYNTSKTHTGENNAFVQKKSVLQLDKLISVKTSVSLATSNNVESLVVHTTKSDYQIAFREQAKAARETRKQFSNFRFPLWPEPPERIQKVFDQ